MKFLLPTMAMFIGLVTDIHALGVQNTLCEYRADPLGIDVPQPRLSWILESPARGEIQTAYQVLAASSLTVLASDHGDLWDSGAVRSDQTTLIAYAGKPLLSAQQVFWKVRTWGKDGQPTAWSAPAAWTVGILSEADWQPAKWIGAVGSETAERKGRGYHAGETSQQNDVKWVQIDLGATMPLAAVRLSPMQHDGKDGFGFPVRFKIEVSDDPNFGSAQTIADQSLADCPNPGGNPVTFNAAPVRGRFVRVTATKLWMRDATHFPFALSQIEVISADKNVAVGKAVAAKDSVDDFGWKKESVVDGLGTDTAKIAQPSTLLLRREFAVRPGLRRATAFVCGLGYYEMTLNGGKVTEDVLTPGWTKYNKTCLYDTYDVTRLLTPGANAVGLFLGNGMYRVLGGQGRYSKFTGSFGSQKAIAQIRLEYQDGTSAVLITDENWQAAAGPVTFTSVYGGEDYDARLAQSGWDRPGLVAAPAAWNRVAVTKGPGGALKGLSCAAMPIRKFDLFKPVKTTVLKNGATVYDLGQNAAQMPRITVHGTAGSSVKITPAELVREDGSVDQASTGSPTYCVYTLAGNAKETWSPRFFYSGYRYLQVECLPSKEGGGAPVVDEVQSFAVHTSAAPVGEFATSNDLLNRIWTLVRWAQLSNMVSALTDCPHREKLGWLEQIHLNGPALRYNFDLNAFFTKTMNDMADSQLDSGLIPTTAPEYTVFGGDFRDSPEWGSAFLLVAWQQYLFTGDTELLHRYYDGMARYVDYLGRRGKDDIVSHGLSDWYDIGPGKPGGSKLTPKGVTATAFYYQDSLILAQTAALLGKTEDAAKFQQQAERIRAAFNNKFFNAATAQYATGSQAADSIPAVMGIAAPDRREAVLKNIVADVGQKGLTAGDVGYRYLLRALADAGRSDVIYSMVNQSEKPGYGMMLAKGATSLLEAWDGERSSSQDHFMLGQSQRVVLLRHCRH